MSTLCFHMTHKPKLVQRRTVVTGKTWRCISFIHFSSSSLDKKKLPGVRPPPHTCGKRLGATCRAKSEIWQTWPLRPINVYLQRDGVVVFAVRSAWRPRQKTSIWCVSFDHIWLKSSCSVCVVRSYKHEMPAIGLSCGVFNIVLSRAVNQNH